MATLFGKSPEYPEQSKLACQYLQIPASSGPVERLFSIIGKVFRPDKCSLNDKLFEILHCNMSLDLIGFDDLFHLQLHP